MEIYQKVFILIDKFSIIFFFFLLLLLFFILRRYKFLIYKFTISTVNLIHARIKIDGC